MLVSRLQKIERCKKKEERKGKKRKPQADAYSLFPHYDSPLAKAHCMANISPG
jgi:hypothetical protein